MTTTARWDDGRLWDDGTLWDDEGVETSMAYGVEVDWAGDGIFDGSSDSIGMVSWSMFRGRRNMVNPNGTGYEPIQTGSLSIFLDNNDGRYDPRNTASPLYPNVAPGKEIRFRIADPITDILYPVFRGVITAINPSGYGSRPRVEIKVADGWEFLRRYNAAASVLVNTTPTAAVGKILDAVGWPAGYGRSLDTITDNIPYWWAPGNNKAGPELEIISNSFLSAFFVDNTGKARLLSRTSVSASVVDYSQETLLKDIDDPQPWENVFNVTQIKIHPRALAALGNIYQLSGNVPSILPGSANALTLYPNYTYSNVACPAINVITPVSGTDWTTNTLANGTGTNKTGSCTIAFVDLGQTAKVVITNNDAGLVYLTKLIIRGYSIYEQNAADVTFPVDLSGVSNKRLFSLDLLWQQDINAAISFSGVVGAFLAGYHPYPIIRIENRPEMQYAPDLFDIVTLTADRIGLGGLSFRVGGIEHRSDPSIETCQRVTTTLYLEPYISADSFWKWDSQSVFDTSTIFGY